MWSLVKAMGTSRMFFLSRITSPLIASSVCGLSQGNGPTWQRDKASPSSSSSSGKKTTFLHFLLFLAKRQHFFIIFFFFWQKDNISSSFFFFFWQRDNTSPSFSSFSGKETTLLHHSLLFLAKRQSRSFYNCLHLSHPSRKIYKNKFDYCVCVCVCMCVCMNACTRVCVLGRVCAHQGRGGGINMVTDVCTVQIWTYFFCGNHSGLSGVMDVGL